MADRKMSPIPPQKILSEKKEFLRREEIKTMQKEINKINEDGVQKERDKINSFEVKKQAENKDADITKQTQLEESKRMDEARKIRELLAQQRKMELEEKITQEPAEIKKSEINETQKVFTIKNEIPFKTREEIKIEANPAKNEEQIEEKYQTLTDKKQEIFAKKSGLSNEIERLKTDLVPVFEKEKATKTEKEKLEEKETKAVLAEEKRMIESKRWEVEKQIQEVEKERWSIEEDIEACQAEMEKIEASYQKILLEEKETERQKEEIKKREQTGRLREEKNKLTEDLTALIEAKSRLEIERDNSLAKKNKIGRDRQKALENEGVIEAVVKQLEEKESLASNSQEKRKIELERWEAEKQRSEAEKIRWATEIEDGNTTSQLNKTESLIRESTKKKEFIEARLKEINLQIGPEEITKADRPETPKVEKEKESTEGNKSLEPKKSYFEGYVEKEKNYSLEEETKIEETLQKNIPDNKTSAWTKPETNIRQTIEPRENHRYNIYNSEEESDRIKFFERTQELEDKRSALSRQKTIEKEYEPKPETPAPLHKKQSPLEKLWVRFIIIIFIFAILFFVFTFWYWYLGNNK
jgi:hypothetical protein